MDGLPIELSFLSADGAAPAALVAAQAQARAQGITPEAALLARGAIDETSYYQSLARHLGVIFIDREIALGASARYPHSIHAGIAPLGGDSGPRWLAAPPGAALADLLHRARRGELARMSLAITTPTHLSRLVRAYAAAAIAREASFGLASLDASFSAKEGPNRAQFRFVIAAIGIAALALALAPASASILLSMAANLLFLAAILLRLFAGAASVGAARNLGRVPTEDRQLPTYSIVVALHREARVAAQLVAALEAIDYPRGKLDIKLVIEEDDRATRLALEALRLPPAYEIIVAPDGAPRTKPRALNVALPLLRGEFMAIFDAEDAPAPHQLREAAERFLRAPRRLACLQARLTIDNIEDSWLTRLFSIEYAMLFDVLHSGLAALRLPLPLGGSSNHFRTDVLREVCGWDAWNVTEDADLGLRLARFGYRTGTLPSSTQEEAPSGVIAWLTQRRRWAKGWMQTLITLSRDPRRVLAEIGAADASALVLMMTGLVIAPPLWPFLTAFMIHELMTIGLAAEPSSGLALVQVTLWVSVALFGIGSVLWLSLLGMKRRKLLGLWPFLPLLFPYYLMMSVAAWAALYDLILRPYHWHKTEHGLAKSSRRNMETIAARAAAAKANFL
ncbi:glycosyltransferase [Methylocapsa polymorpha]|uniref:Glycosyltransferase n=1 Tax=Methylocapsa polymorpha TaxID=3080828 RepID=A0ABZ0HX26_9HYPH|nr:glycosyltransferase [Methylocapsa sp. RX1]